MLGRILGGVGKVLIACGLVVLGFVGFQLWGTGLETARGQDQLTGELAADVSTEGEDGSTVDLSQLNDQLSERDAEAVDFRPPEIGEAVGIITIDKIQSQHVIIQGVSKAELKKGPGHYPNTPFPGQPGNVGIAGHRTTYGAPFNRIDELAPGDEVRMATPQGEFVYDVIAAPGQTAQAWYTVSPNQVEVLNDMGDDRVTLTACHPKYSAKQRIIVHAVLRSQPAPAVEVVDTETAAVVAEERAENFDEGLEGDSSALPRALLFGGAAAAIALLATLLGRYMRKWPIYLVATPAVLVLIWFGYVYMDRYLPAL